eukprot:TRINITY_DN11591_c0_g2_i6.p1 TRINITY_DN11591_c0_g2~~TRINITY_DN11591_c0_g2_i6.p1  ORF type:complete len:360 (-),score=65.33 TRINITY_DN11591_c0_g2_i6:142-1221(-)
MGKEIPGMYSSTHYTRNGWVMNMTIFFFFPLVSAFQSDHSQSVDASVVADSILGITMGILKNIDVDNNWFDSEIANVYSDSVDYLNWVVSSGQILKRPDIGLLYYPNVFDLLWFMGRTLNILESQPSLPFPEFQNAREIFKQALEGNVTTSLLLLSKTADGYTFWDDFLGDNDTNWLGYPIERGEDRIFSTAASVNTLFDIWTRETKVNGKKVLKWKSNTPLEVKLKINNALKFILDYVDGSFYRKDNAFFSGSLKGISTIPYLYPQNLCEFLNGTVIANLTLSDFDEGPIVVGISGVIPPDKWKEIKNKPAFLNYSVPDKFQGFNENSGVLFPYWSSPTLTYSMSLLALVKSNNIQHE